MWNYLLIITTLFWVNSSGSYICSMLEKHPFVQSPVCIFIFISEIYVVQFQQILDFSLNVRILVLTDQFAFFIVWIELL